MNRATSLLLAIAVPVLWQTRARADERGQQIIEKIDELQTSAHDQYFVFEMTTYQEGKEPKSMTFEVTIMGTRFRRVKFLAPGDMKGTRMLVRALDQMYIYLPAYRRVRRIASHVRDQGFMGSAYSYDEMAIVTYADVFDCSLKEETDALYRLRCNRRPGKSFHYPVMEMDVDKKILRPVELRFYNEKGTKLKTDYRKDYKCDAKVKQACTPQYMKLVDHTRGDLYTEMKLKDWKVNTGVDEKFFTVRALQRDR
ncbi:MAG: outer membrane lipoprotein-sorting protein [Deltaproteobacteria bacterium]|nr:MAG: outer membrane lipoprotein-sorting protein [Deltaproteobacteria bacterium]